MKLVPAIQKIKHLERMYNMDERDLWDEIYDLISDSSKEICVFDGDESAGYAELKKMNLIRKSTLGAIVTFSSGISIDNWIRIIGQENLIHKGILSYQSYQKENVTMKSMTIVGQDVVGGIFAINIGKYPEGLKKVWYFAPDNLQWECMDMNYAEFVAWAIQGNTDEFYSSMRWNGWKEDCSKVGFEEMILIYPFLWSKECNLETASKTIVSSDELIRMNSEYAHEFGYY